MLATPHLLIADDDRDLRETLHSLFAARGFHTQLAADGEEAWRIVRTSQVHVVLIDLQMPKLSGLEAIERIKAYRVQIPCILVSGAVVEHAPLDDVFCVLTKPVRGPEVVRQVNLALEMSYPELFGAAGGA